MSQRNVLFLCHSRRSLPWRPCFPVCARSPPGWTGGFREHLPDGVRGNFERLMLSGSRALEFLGGQGITALGNLVLSRRDSLLLDVCSMASAEEVACLHYFALPSSSGLFPTPLLDSALTKMRAASKDALVQRTLHPPKIPRKSSVGPVKAGSSSTSSADRGGTSPVLPQSQSSMAPSSSSTQSGRKSGVARVRLPFRQLPEAPEVSEKGQEKVLFTRSRLCCGWGLPVSALEALAGYWCRLLGAVHPEGRIPNPLQGLSFSPRSHPDIVSDISGRISSGTGFAPGSREDAVQGCLGDHPQSGSQLLQSSFPDGKGDRGLASRDRLSHLNEFVLQTPFKMETVASVLLSVREGDFLASIDLKDAYFQIPVHQSSRTLLRFLSGGTVYQFKALCFGLSTAPQVFTRVFAAVSAWAHSHGIRLLGYMDDWLVLASLEVEAKRNVQDLLSLCHSLRIVINEKSDLVPSQTANYLGMTIDTGPPGFFCPLHGSRNFCQWQRCFVLCLLPQLNFGRWFWDTWLCWRGWFHRVAFECTLCSGI